MKSFRVSILSASCWALLSLFLAIAGPAAASATGNAAAPSSSSPKAAEIPSRKPASTSGRAAKKPVGPAKAKPASTAGKRTAGRTKNTRRGTTGTGSAAGNIAANEAPCYRPAAGRGRCEPQCLPYTRCRSGIDSCRTGHENGPVTWFRCEQARGNTSVEPAQGRVMVLGRNAHNMRTGHTLYVEKVESRSDGRYALTLSHTNYDRRCSLETNMLADYDPKAQTIDVQSGKWEAWGRDLKVAGFILN